MPFFYTILRIYPEKYLYLIHFRGLTPPSHSFSLLLMKFLSLLFALITCQLCLAQEATKAKKKPWPTVLKGKGHAKVIMPDSNSTAPFIYTTKSYRFISQQQISKTKITKLAATAESVASAVSRIPLSLSAPSQSEAKPAIYIYNDEESYLKAGGAPASAGYYSGRKNAVFLRADKFLGKKKPNYQLLTHELVHLNMHSIIGYSRAWFSEGNADYFASAFYATSSYNFTDMTRNIKNRARHFYPDNTIIELPPLKEFVELDFRQWRKLNQQLAPEDRYTPYLASLLIVHYFYHIDPDGREKIQTYLTALHQRASNRKRRPSLEDQAHLFPAADLNKIQTTITTYWNKRGLKVKFQ